MTHLLEVKSLEVAYGAIKAVKGIDFHVSAGQVVALIGSNGAGKTTTLRTISGILRPSGGEILFDGQSIGETAAHSIVTLGLAHSPEGRRVFPRLTVADNLDMGAFTRRDQDEVNADRERVYATFPRLAERRKQKAGTLSGGEQQMLAMGRALMSKPRLLMLDDASMGLSAIMMKLIFDTVAELKAAGTTILLVEQNAQAALALADFAYVVETGRIVLSGPGPELLGNPEVRKAYLGEE